MSSKEPKADNLKTITVPLDHPITTEDGKVSELTFRQAILADAILADNAGSNALNRNAIMLAAMAGVPPTVIKAMTMTDMNKVFSAIGSMMGNAPSATGSGS